MAPVTNRQGGHSCHLAATFVRIKVRGEIEEGKEGEKERVGVVFLPVGVRGVSLNIMAMRLLCLYPIFVAKPLCGQINMVNQKLRCWFNSFIIWRALRVQKYKYDNVWKSNQ